MPVLSTFGAMSARGFGFGGNVLFEHIITSSQKEINLNTYLTSQGWNGTVPVLLTINSGVYIWSDSTSTAALTIPSVFSGKLSIINNGYIMGKGGAGGRYRLAGSNGGHAISNSAAEVTMFLGSNGYVGGGGGGGAGGSDGTYGGGGGGGAGGGAGGNGYDGGDGVLTGGAGGAIGQSGKNGGNGGWNTQGLGNSGGGTGAGYSASGSGLDDTSAGGGGGRIFPSSTKTGLTGGGSNTINGKGGNGGGAGVKGGAGSHVQCGAGGGGWGADGGASSSRAGGTAGKAVTGTPISFSGTTSHRYGANG